jgi:integrase
MLSNSKAKGQVLQCGIKVYLAPRITARNHSINELCHTARPDPILVMTLFSLGHADVSTTMIYTHVLNRGGQGVVSPLDGL